MFGYLLRPKHIHVQQGITRNYRVSRYIKIPALLRTLFSCDLRFTRLLCSRQYIYMLNLYREVPHILWVPECCLTARNNWVGVGNHTDLTQRPGQERSPLRGHLYKRRKRIFIATRLSWWVDVSMKQGSCDLSTTLPSADIMYESSGFPIHNEVLRR